jgi:hypothetical protein
LVTLAGASGATLTTMEMGWYDAPGPSASLRLHVTLGAAI